MNVLRGPLLAAFAFAGLFPDASAAAGDTLRVESVLWVGSVGQGGRGPVFTDAIEQRRVSGTWRAPSEGDTVRLPAPARGFPAPPEASAEFRVWARVVADSSGVLPVEGGYALAQIDVSEEGAWILEAVGHRHVYVNGEPRVGDFYGYETTSLPVFLRQGRNELLFRVARGPLRVWLIPPRQEIDFATRDLTLPDLIRSDPDTCWLGIPVLNATAERRTDLVAVATCPGVPSLGTPLPILPAHSMRKMPVALPPLDRVERDTVLVTLRLETRAGAELSTVSIPLRVRSPDEKHRRTFVSEIDGSVQYYAVTPPESPPAPATSTQAPAPALALFLSLHGASVEATNQANAYGPKDWGVVVAPTNRRPYGFDWEDWGRLDALEVLAEGRRIFSPDPGRIYLTGHSMGGHGTWNLGALFPDHFAAIAPSAGWPDFWSYAGALEWKEPDPVERLLTRAANTSRTQLLAANYRAFGVYILHGEVDDNVPVEQGRAMRALLGDHPDLAYHEQPGAGHWWGNECMDWPPLFEFLRARVLRPASEIREVDFTTVNPAVSARCHWITVLQQSRCLEPSRVRARITEPAGGPRRLAVETENVLSLSIDPAAFGGGRSHRVHIDRDTLDLEVRPTEPVCLARDTAGGWRKSAPPSREEKNPDRAGPFKEAFRHRFALVYGTGGTPEENAWAHAKARYDAEQFWYRGNGSVDVVSDREFVASLRGGTSDRDRGVILYGHRDMNTAWGLVHDGTGIDVAAGRITIGDRVVEGPDLAVLFTQPRRDAGRIPGVGAVASPLVAAVAGTGIRGLRLTDQLPYFVSGVAYPDWIVFGPELLERGSEGVRGLGFFGPDWTYDPAQSAWR